MKQRLHWHLRSGALGMIPVTDLCLRDQADDAVNEQWERWKDRHAKSSEVTITMPLYTEYADMSYDSLVGITDQYCTGAN